MTKNHGRHLLFVVVASSAVVLASCSPNRNPAVAPSAPEVSDTELKNLSATVTWWNNYQIPTAEQLANPETQTSSTFREYFYLQNVIKGFNAIYPNITIRSEYKGSYNDIQTAVNTALSGGNTPTIASTYGDAVAGYNKVGATLAMDNYLTSANYGLGKTLDSQGAIIDDASTAFSDFNQSYLEAEKGMYASKTYLSLPYSKSAETLAINQSVFDKVGAGAAGTSQTNGYTAPEAVASKQKYNVPTNWKELIATARAMKTDFPTLFANQKDQDNHFTAVPFVYDSGSNMYISFSEMMGIPYTSNASENVAEQVLFNNDQAKAMMVQLKKWNNEGLIATQDQLPVDSQGRSQYSSTLLTQGKVFMAISSTAGARYFSGNGFVSSLNETPSIDVNSYDGATGTPSSAKSKVISQGPSLTFFKKANANENVAAFLFYKYLTNTDNSAQLAVNTAYFPLRTSSYQTQNVQSLLNAPAPTESSSSNEKSTYYTGTALRLNSTYTEGNRYFLSPVFDLSSAARTAVGNLVKTVFDAQVTSDADIQRVVDEAFTTAYQSVITSN